MYSVRQATATEMAGVRAVANRFGNLGGWPDRPDYLDRELANGRLLAGLAGDTVVGFGATFARGGLLHLADLFVLPEHQSSGLGRSLLATLLPRDAPRVTFASADPRALALYVRQGMRPVSPLLYLRGPLAALPDRGLRPSAATPEAVAELDADASGGRRAADLAWYAGLPGVSGYRVGDGYVMVRETAGGLLVGPAGGRTTRACADAVLAVLVRHRSAGTAKLCVLGPNPLLPLLLEARFTIADLDQFLSSGGDPVALDRYLPHPDLG
ncbi:GNAT family N-acetyltransferase [Catellatospora sichuanensis]|uniref:GNAT family N-acetyltransferase n=1 Tax=Catellatospora sichuanensis TaxID=1969805 RepID=UPI0016429E30|nr:GNAT family N-acetyltransferase [Catellatospora sichuanensis]